MLIVNNTRNKSNCRLTGLLTWHNLPLTNQAARKACLGQQKFDLVPDWLPGLGGTKAGAGSVVSLAVTSKEWRGVGL